MTALSEKDAAALVSWGPAQTWQAVGSVVTAVVVGFAGVTVVLAVTSAPSATGTATGIATLAISLLAELAMVAAVWWFAVRRRGASWGVIGFRPPKANRMAIGVPATLFSAFFLVGLFSFIVFKLGWRDLDDSSLPPELLAGSLLVALFVTSVIVAPLAEETFFRGFVFGGLRGSWGTIRAGAASAALFGLAHPDLILIVPVTILGLLLVTLYVWTDSLWGPIAVHAMFNSLQLLPELTSGAGA